MKFWTIPFLGLFINLTAYAGSSTEGEPQHVTAKVFGSSSEKPTKMDNKALIESFYQAFQTHDTKTLNSLLLDGYGFTSASDLQDSSYSKYSEMSKNMKVRATSMKKALPDFTVKIDELIAEGDKVVARVTINGIQKGDFLGVAATNKPISLKICSSFTVKDQKITYIHEMWNEYSVMKQIGSFVL